MSGRAFLVVWVVFVSVAAPGHGTVQEADETAAQEQATAQGEEEAKEEKDEGPTVVVGTLVGDDGAPVSGLNVELFMVVEGRARDAFGNPLKGTYSLGAGRQALGMMFGRETYETDSEGRFSLELPKYLLVPSGTKMQGFTIGVREGDALKTLSIEGKSVAIVPNPDAKEVELGRLTLSPPAADE